MVIRGQVITSNLVEVGGRGGDLRFLTPDANLFLDRLPLRAPSALADLYTLSFEDILDYLEELGTRLDVRTNEHLHNALQHSYATAPTTKPLLDHAYANLHKLVARPRVRELADRTVGINHLEGWVEQDTTSGIRTSIRCFGARTLHIVAGNSPTISLNTIVRNAILRSDALIKAPSNDPFTALAIAQTMVDMAPDHPLTRHLTVAYWRGGDVTFEEKFYRPQNIEKIVAWGGFASVKHVTRYIQPGLELISLDPKLSASVVGSEALANEASMRDAARRLATDIGAVNQAACVSSRVSYIMTGTDEGGIAKLNAFGQMVYDALLALPESTSTPAKRYDPDLKDHVDALRLDGDWFNVIGGRDGEGAVIVSLIPEPVDFSALLNDRTANLVAVDTIDDFVAAVNSYTQTVGVYPESLKADLLDLLPLFGAQRFVSLGYASVASGVGPQDGIELVRRMGKWIINEVATPDVVPPLWEARVVENTAS